MLPKLTLVLVLLTVLWTVSVPPPVTEDMVPVPGPPMNQQSMGQEAAGDENWEDCEGDKVSDIRLCYGDD